MAGILNSKTRILDTILTLEGRRQLADGDFQVKYVSFTDGSSFYQASHEGQRSPAKITGREAPGSLAKRTPRGNHAKAAAT